MLSPGDAPTNELGPLQHANVLAGRGKGHFEGQGELAKVALPTGELPNHRATGRVSQGVKNEV